MSVCRPMRPTPPRTIRYVVVANQNGKLLHRIETDANGNDRLRNAGDIASIRRPGPGRRHDAQRHRANSRSAPRDRPNNAPICPVITSDSRLTFVTLAGGGLFVVDAKQAHARRADADRRRVHQRHHPQRRLRRGRDERQAVHQRGRAGARRSVNSSCATSPALSGAARARRPTVLPGRLCSARTAIRPRRPARSILTVRR